ncbi:hypothetical protein FRB94_011870 [Tulasnella sp. JGI-2019a]|nr:hypothetical protein FRB94_011870 [Tulasnella sp. JGI-2019a]KAG9014443.1 hypothetical protein FRB93_013568 [Tulasnella sp. JGI-2019a]KAG9039702.1 hypothetical protein FRB95_007129 [Tulasnella sp. JGI-2019a]
MFAVVPMDEPPSTITPLRSWYTLIENYVFFAAFTAALYDICLTIEDEIEHIWVGGIHSDTKGLGARLIVKPSRKKGGTH